MNILNIVSQHIGTMSPIIFDIGACDFQDSMQLKLLFPQSSVYSVEADSINYERHYQKANILGINTYNFAISDEDGETIFYPSLEETKRKIEWRYAGSILKPVLKPNTNEAIGHTVTYDTEGVKVKTKRFDTFCSEIGIIRPDYLHLDVEGAETKVVSSFGDNKPRLIFAETCNFHAYETGTTLQEFDELMDSLGYDIITRMEFDTLYKLR